MRLGPHSHYLDKGLRNDWKLLGRFIQRKNDQKEKTENVDSIPIKSMLECYAKHKIAS